MANRSAVHSENNSIKLKWEFVAVFLCQGFPKLKLSLWVAVWLLCYFAVVLFT